MCLHNSPSLCHSFAGPNRQVFVEIRMVVLMRAVSGWVFVFADAAVERT